MIRQHREAPPAEIVPPRLERVEDGQQLLLVHRIVALCLGHLLGQERDRPQPVVELLHQHRSRRVARRVRVHDEVARRIRDGQARRGHHGRLELLERLLLLRAPLEPLPRRSALRSSLGGLERAAQFRERSCNLAEASDEAPVVARQPEELLHFLLRRGSWPAIHRCDLALHHAHARSPDEVTEELHLLAEEAAFAQLGEQLLLPQPLQHHPQMLLVLLQRAAVDQNVVQEHQHELVELAAEGVLHERHELGRRVRQAHRQNQPLEVTVSRSEGRLRHVLCSDADLPVARAQVEFAEVARPLQLVEQLVDARKRIAVACCRCVERAVVDHHALAAVWLLDEEHGRAPRRARWPNEALRQQLLDHLARRLRVLLRHARPVATERPSALLQIDAEGLAVARRRDAGWQLLREHVHERSLQLPHDLVRSPALLQRQQ